MATENVLTGRVKWFNNKSGYGFVTVILSKDDDSLIGKDVFAHHSSVIVSQEQFRYLVQGEYVEFTLSDTTDDKSDHKFQTANLKGIGGGFLMCETRFETRTFNNVDVEDGDAKEGAREGGKAPKWNVSHNNKRSTNDASR